MHHQTLDIGLCICLCHIAPTHDRSYVVRKQTTSRRSDCIWYTKQHPCILFSIRSHPAEIGTFSSHIAYYANMMLYRTSMSGTHNGTHNIDLPPTEGAQS